ncbi:MAG: transketolase [Aquificae bacterium]|nr:transketolase [Aquificota bacterium]
MSKSIDELCINTIRFLSVDAIEKAKSGHPGMPLGAAPMAYVLWDRFLKHNPKNPKWFNRDRFILSAGHGSMLLYSLLYLSGYDLTLEDIKQFRQWGSKTPGHPEYGLTPGVEATTGPLGQGFGMGVGMAMAECFLADRYNKPDFKLVDHYIYAIVSDGDLMEGISTESASLAGKLKLGKLIYLYDCNYISIEGDTRITFVEDVELKFKALGWHVINVKNDGNDIEAIAGAIRIAQLNKEQPSLIIVRTHIGYGSPKQDSPAAHGEPLGEEAVIATKKRFNWPLEPFYVPKEALEHCRKAVDRGKKWEDEWNRLFEKYKKVYPDLAEEFEKAIKGELPKGWDKDLPRYFPEGKKIATRVASGETLNVIAKRVPYLLGGSADLGPSNKTILKGEKDFLDCFNKQVGRNLHFGVREHAMGAAVNGMTLHGGVIPYGATFLVFSDYMREPLRLSALMKVHSIFIFTHDSIGVGEDGPTHQPIEQVMSLRLIPDFTVIRPADANETVVAWKLAMTLKEPVALVLTRQGVPVLDPEKYPIYKGVPYGAYVLKDSIDKPDIILVGTGSEVHLALEASFRLEEKGLNVRVVSMPSWELFFKQPKSYREEVLLSEVPKLAVEAGSCIGWRDIVGDTGDVICLNRFGVSAPGEVVMERLGFNVDNVLNRALKLLEK